jgi:hypothetical protein
MTEKKLNNQEENLNPSYEIAEDKSVTITSGKFEGVVLRFTDFEIADDYNQNEDGTESHLISYNYEILKGEIPVNEGNEIKTLMRSIINDIIANYQDVTE